MLCSIVFWIKTLRHRAGLTGDIQVRQRYPAMADKNDDDNAEVVAFDLAKSTHEFARKERRLAMLQKRFRTATKQILNVGRKSKRGKKGKGGKGGW